MAAGDTTGAVSAWEDAVVRAPARSDVRLRLAAHYLQHSELDAAERHYRAVLQRQPSNATALNGMGLVADLRGKSAEAVAFFKRAVASDPKMAAAWNNLGVALEKTGDSSGARRAYRKALEADPKCSDAAKNLERLGK